MKLFKIPVVLLMLFSFSGLLAANIPTEVDLSLIDQQGKPFEFQQLKGNVVLLFFGYTSCPDVCPMEVSIMARVLKKFNAQDQHVKGVFVSVDAERDTAEVMRQYLAYFDADITGLTGSREQIDELVKHYHANYQIDRTADNTLSVQHSSNLIVLDQQGTIDTMVPFGMDANHVIKVVDRLLNFSNNSKEVNK